MHDHIYLRTLDFLETQISQNPENKDLLAAYLKVIELDYQHIEKMREHDLQDDLSRDQVRIEALRLRRAQRVHEQD